MKDVVSVSDQITSGYDRISLLRQEQDLDPLLKLAPKDIRHILDLGCGTGTLLQRAALHFSRLERLAGVDLLSERITKASRKLDGVEGEVELHAADLREGIPVGGPFDFVVMSSVLHWLYPAEERIFAWIAEILSERGVFSLSTYHPSVEWQGCGGTDLLVCDALRVLGLGQSDIMKRFEARGILPIATRTRQAAEIEAVLRCCFTLDYVEDRVATMCVESAEQYREYHKETFGKYYLSLLAPADELAFLQALGEVAIRRMSTMGFVTNIPIRLWRCLSANGEPSI